MNKLAAILCTAAFLVVPATASAGNAYGDAVKECFGMSYGQAKNAAWASGHASKPALGAKATAIAHGCTD
jgi:hypothetical protein